MRMHKQHEDMKWGLRDSGKKLKKKINVKFKNKIKLKKIKLKLIYKTKKKKERKKIKMISNQFKSIKNKEQIVF